MGEQEGLRKKFHELVREVAKKGKVSETKVVFFLINNLL